MTDPIESLSNAIVEKGYRLTSARRAVVKCLVQSGGHISADDLAVRVRQTAPHVGRMTVFRTLDLLTELGLIRPTYQGTGAAHYILMEQGSHHHLICNRCHRVIDFDECLEDELTHMLSQKFDFQVLSHVLEVHGLCQSCHG